MGCTKVASGFALVAAIASTAAPAAIHDTGAPSLRPASLYQADGITVPTPIEYPPLDHSLWRLQATGLRARLATARFREAPDAPETAGLLLEVGRPDDALDVLRGAMEGDASHVEHALRILVEESHEFRDGSKDYASRRRELAEVARGRLDEFQDEEAARVAWRLLGLDHMLAGGGSRGYDEQVARFIEAYAGTEFATQREMGQRAEGLRGAEYLAAVEAIANEAMGTSFRPEALYHLGWQLHSSNTRGVREPGGSDPTERFLRVLEIVEELESGIYPPSEWVENAPTLVTGFFASSRSVYAPENIPRIVEGVERFARDHFVLDYEGPTLSHAINYLITHKLARVYESSAIGIAGMEDTFDRLEREIENVAAVRYLRAEFYKARADEAESSEREAWMGRAIETLAELADLGDSLYHRKALATLASLLFFERHYERALRAHQIYLDRYPRTDWAWAARLRIGQAHEAVGNWEAAASAYLAAAESGDRQPPAQVLGYAAYAHAREALGAFDESLRAHRLALDAWDDDYGRTYSFTTSHAPAPGNERGSTERTLVTEQSLGERLAELEASAAVDSGALLERGRWLMGQGRWDEARAAFEAVLADRPGSPLAGEARGLSHRARFERALELGDIEKPASDPAAALQELEALSSEPWTPPVGAAGLARAAILWTRGIREQAEELTEAALRDWRREQRVASSTTQEDLVRDVEEIRNVVFRPQGGTLYENERWNGFRWPGGAARFVIVDPEIPTELPNGDVVTITVATDPPGMTNILWARETDLKMFYGILDSLGGTAKREPRAVMEVPNQPVGPSLEILDLWQEFFAARPGHWGGWVLETYPIIARIEFLDDERTRAAAAVRIGYAGATVVLEKRDGAWVAVRLTNRWVT